MSKRQQLKRACWMPKSVPLSGTTAFKSTSLYAPPCFFPPPRTILSPHRHHITSNHHPLIQGIPLTNTMFRSVILRAPLRAASFALARPSAALRPASITLARGYAASAGLAKDDISSRVLEVMKTFEKVDGGKVGPYLG